MASETLPTGSALTWCEARPWCMTRCMAWHGASHGTLHGALHGASHSALHGESRRGRHLVKEDLEPPCTRGARLPMRRRAGGHAARLARYDLAVHRERDHIWLGLGLG